MPLLNCKHASKLQVSQNVLCWEDNKVIKSTLKRKFANVLTLCRVKCVDCAGVCVYSCKINGPAIKCNIFSFEVRQVSQSVNSGAGCDKACVTSVIADGPDLQTKCVMWMSGVVSNFPLYCHAINIWGSGRDWADSCFYDTEAETDMTSGWQRQSCRA